MKNVILNKLEGPTLEEVWGVLNKLNPTDMLDKSYSINFLDGYKKAYELGADIHVFENVYFRDAASNGYLNFVQFYLELKPTELEYMDALFSATKSKNIDVIKLFLKYWDGESLYGIKNAYSVAKKGNSTEIISLLKDFINKNKWYKKWL